MTPAIVTGLTGFTLPGGGLLRDHTRPPEQRTDAYLTRFDRHTLYYDCVYQPARGQYLFTAPPLSNLWEPFRDGLRNDGKPVRQVKRTQFKGWEQIELAAPRGALTFTLDGTEHRVATRDALSPYFKGLNAVLTVSRNNPLDWIRDWATYYVGAHGLEAVLFFDNGSDLYGPQEIAQTLSAVDGLKTIAVLTAPYPYGPTAGWQGGPTESYLQSAMLNLARRDGLSDARAALNVDIDEIVLKKSDVTVFDAAVRRPNSLVKIHGSWAFPGPETPVPAPQRAHVWRTDPRWRCPQKWCAVPRGLFSRFGWSPHHVGGKLVKLVFKDPRFEFAHCRGTSTSWKESRLEMPEVVFDTELADVMSRYIPQTGTPL